MCNDGEFVSLFNKIDTARVGCLYSCCRVERGPFWAPTTKAVTIITTNTGSHQSVQHIDNPSTHPNESAVGAHHSHGSSTVFKPVTRNVGGTLQNALAYMNSCTPSSSALQCCYPCQAENSAKLYVFFSSFMQPFCSINIQAFHFLHTSTFQLNSSWYHWLQI